MVCMAGPAVAARAMRMVGGVLAHGCYSVVVGSVRKPAEKD